MRSITEPRIFSDLAVIPLLPLPMFLGFVGLNPSAISALPPRDAISGNDLEDGSERRLLVAARHFLSGLSAFVSGFQCRRRRRYQGDHRPVAVFAGTWRRRPPARRGIRLP